MAAVLRVIVVKYPDHEERKRNTKQKEYMEQRILPRPPIRACVSNLEPGCENYAQPELKTLELSQMGRSGSTAQSRFRSHSISPYGTCGCSRLGKAIFMLCALCDRSAIRVPAACPVTKEGVIIALAGSIPCQRLHAGLVRLEIIQCIINATVGEVGTFERVDDFVIRYCTLKADAIYTVPVSIMYITALSVR